MERQKKALIAGVFGAVMGGVSGALVGASLGGTLGAILGGVLGGAYMAWAEANTDAARQPGELKPLRHRILSSTLIVAALGAVLAGFLSLPLTGILIGVMAGLFGMGPRKLLIGITLGVLMGFAAGSVFPANGAILAGGIILIYRLVLALMFRDTEPLQVVGEKVPPEQARFVVPFEARSAYIGTDYMQMLAHDTDGTFKRNQPGIGLVDSLDSLQGPRFDPTRINRRIRDFYEHTSQYRLVIEPEWKTVMKPFFALFKLSIAQKIGQANLPFDIEEAQRGIVSFIDTIDYPGGEDSPVRTLRGWIRAFEATGEAIYVGIYTVVRHEDIGYISVGFPLPESNFSATLLPYNKDDRLLLKTQDTGLTFPGHYLSDIDNDTGELTIVKLPTFGEEIEVYVQDGELKTDHRFYLGGFKFLTLYYHITSKDTPPA